MRELVLVGAGGHCRSVIDVIESTSQYKIVAIVDKKENIGKSILDYKITHSDEDLENLFKKYKFYLVTIGQIKTPDPRIKIAQAILGAGCQIETVIAKTAYVSKHAKIGMGTVVMHGTFVNANAVIGDNCIINTTALIEHDVLVESNSHISTATVLNGGAIVREGSFVGSNAVVRENFEVPSRSIIPAGSALLKRTYEK